VDDFPTCVLSELCAIECSDFNVISVCPMAASVKLSPPISEIDLRIPPCPDTLATAELGPPGISFSRRAIHNSNGKTEVEKLCFMIRVSSEVIRGTVPCAAVCQFADLAHVTVVYPFARERSFSI
jgi:hypothetical protein